MTDESGDLGLQPGSRAPENADEVERLLKAVPGIVFQPEFDDCFFESDSLSGTPSPAELELLCTAAWQEGLLAGLDRLDARADGQDNAGLKFLVHTLRHFLTVQKIAANEHPLTVGLYLRSYARKDETPDDFEIIVRKMDEWGVQ